jgi:hypothetical protein
LRKYKLLERIYKKLEDHSLSLEDKKCLWKMAIRTFKLGKQSDSLSAENVVKLFRTRPDILFARHLAGVEAD